MNSVELLKHCHNILPGHGPGKSISENLREIADQLETSDLPDKYGQGEYLQAFEAEVAAMFGKQAAVFMPSGTMAQQIAIRIWCDRTGRPTIAMHPTSHLETAEHLGYQFLHHIHRLSFGAPEFLEHRVLTVADFDALASIPGVALLELPYRPLGGRLNSWEELIAIRDWLTERKIPLHLDGARIWQCAAAFQRSLNDIGDLFDSIYVSFYKDLGGISGCMLMGDDAFIAEARVWQRRYGGNLFDQSPFYTAARLKLHQTLPLLPAWVERAKALGKLFAGYDHIIVNPDPPEVNFFRLYLKGNAEHLMQRHHELAEKTGSFLFGGMMPAAMPGYSTTELHVWENAMAFDEKVLPEFLGLLLQT